MTDFQARLDALPKWPKGSYLICRPDEVVSWHESMTYAALARLALAREWIGIEHRPWCASLNPGAEHFRTGKNPPCTCGRDALLAKLEGPR